MAILRSVRGALSRGLWLVVILAMCAIARPVGSAAAAEPGIYVVQPGDTLFSLAQRAGLSVAAAQAANGLSNSQIAVGQRLRLPAMPGRGTYVVAAGDTLFQIALQYNTSVAALRATNGLVGSDIFGGQVLVVGGDVGATAAAGPQQAALEVIKPLGATAAAGAQHIVRVGENVFRIALGYGILAAELRSMNGLTGNLISPGQVLRVPASGVAADVIAVPRPGTEVLAARIARGPFELGGQVTEFSLVTGATRMRDAGMTWVKRQIKWDTGSELKMGKQLIDDGHAAGFKVLLSVVGRPEQSGPAFHPAYAAYVRGLAQLGADAIEVWNEPNLAREWAAGTIGPDAYSVLLRAAAPAIRAGNMRTIIISGGPAPTGFYAGCFPSGCDDLLFMQGLARNGVLDLVDCVGMHYQGGVVSPALSSGDPRATSGHYSNYYSTLIDAYSTATGGRIPLCFTGLGYLSGEEWGYVPADYLWRPPYNLLVREHAEFLAEATRLSRTQQKVWLQMVFNVNVPGFGDDPMAGYSIVRPNSSCPACPLLAAAMAR